MELAPGGVSRGGRGGSAPQSSSFPGVDLSAAADFSLSGVLLVRNHTFCMNIDCTLTLVCSIPLVRPGISFLFVLFSSHLFCFESNFDYTLVREASGLTAHWQTVIYSVRVVDLPRDASHPYFKEQTQLQPSQCCIQPSSHLLGL